MIKIDKKFIINLQGKNFVLFEGLLNLFHENGGQSIKTEIVSTNPFIVQATAEGERGVFQGIGDADETNVNRMIVRHKLRMAETRAICRALRWYNNIGMCSADELGGDDQLGDDQPIKKDEKIISKTPDWDQDFFDDKEKGLGEEIKCPKCKTKMIFKSGEKNGRKWSGKFCPNQECKNVIWNK